MEHILQGHIIKSYATLSWLMKLISFDYYYERILLRYQKAEQDKTSKNLSIQSVIKIMVRSLQMYETIEQIILIFTLLTKLEKA